jgi:hypothetical protein
MKHHTHSGGCMCGGVRYEVTGPLREIIACHCRECQQASSNHVTATAAKPGNLVITEERGLAWYSHGGALNRGFCKLCGSTLFFDHGKEHPTGIAVGSFDTAPDMHVAVHIYTDEAGAWYDLPQDDAHARDTDAWRRASWHDLKWLDV